MIHLPQRDSDGRVKVYASSPIVTATDARDLVRPLGEVNKKKALAKVGSSKIDYSWLKGASETYQVSDNIEDFVIQEVPIVTIGFPNRNLHAFPFEEVSYFDPKFGNFVYKTFVGKGTYKDHDNRDFTQAKGVHFDAPLRKVPGWDVWKIYVLIGFCRQKDPELANAIEKGQRRGYSMGAWVSSFVNSITGQLENGSQPLKYPKGTVHNGVLSYSSCLGVEFFETSSVGDPADVTAESHQIWHF